MKKILVFLLACLSSSMLLAQTHYHPNTGVGELTMDGKCVVRIDGQEGFFESYELGVFLTNNPDECRGATLITSDELYSLYYDLFGHYFYVITIYGEGTEEMTFRLYDHNTNQELTTTASFNYSGNGELGTFDEPFYVDFSTAPQPTTYTLDIEGYGAGNAGGYYLISSPVTEAITPSEANGFVSGNFDLYYFDQTSEDEWINYKLENNGGYADWTINSGKGYLYASESGTTLQFAGTAYNGDGVVPLEYFTTNPSTDMHGWNLISNPFPNEASVDHDYYVMNEGGTELIAGSGPIAAMNGLFVKATEEGQSVTFTPNASNGSDGMIILNMMRDRGAAIDRAIVRLNGHSTLPKFMLNPDNTKIYIPQDGEDYAVVSSTANELPVSFKAASNGTYTLNVATENTEMHYLHLIDNIAGTDTDLLANPSYTFEANTGDHANRFTLVMSTTVGLEEHFAFYNGHNWTVSNEGQATLQVIDMTGRLISTTTIDGTSQLDVNAATGVYMFRLINGNDVKVQKVIIK